MSIPSTQSKRRVDKIRFYRHVPHALTDAIDTRFLSPAFERPTIRFRAHSSSLPPRCSPLQINIQVNIPFIPSHNS